MLKPKYANVESVLFFYLCVTMLALLRAQVHVLCINRGWVKGFFWYAPVIIAAQAFGIWHGELGTLRGIVNLEALVTSVTFAVTAGVCEAEWINYKWQFSLSKVKGFE